MLLRHRTGLLRRLRRGRDDRGSAFVTVIGISAVVALVSVTLVSSVMFGSAQTASTRAGAQAQATAEQAIDTTLAQMSTFTYGTETSFPCSLNQSGTTDSGRTASTLTLKYRTKGSAAFVCPVPTSLEVVEATVTAKSTVTIGTGAGAKTETRTVKQRLSVQDNAVTSTLLPYGVFSGADFTTTNTFNLTGGGVHVNGEYNCNSSGTIVGPVTATSNVYLTNNCRTQSIDAGGTFICNSEWPVITGDVRAAGLGESKLGGNCAISGSVTTAGPIRAAGTAWRVGGNLISSTSSMTFGNSGVKTVNGYGQSGTGMTVTDVNANDTFLQDQRLSQLFGSGYTKNRPSAPPTAPSPVTMPAITWDNLTPLGTKTMTMGAWVQENAVRNNSPASGPKSGSHCDLVGASSWGINGTATNPAGGATVIDATTCDVTLQDVTLNLTNDLTLVVKSLVTNNTVKVTSTKPGTKAKLRVIVASTPGAPTCSATETSKGEIVLRNGFSVASNVDAFFYTNGKLTGTNSVTFSGSIYACKMDVSVSVNITYSDMTPPGMGGGNVGAYSFLPTARYDL